MSLRRTMTGFSTLRALLPALVLAGTTACATRPTGPTACQDDTGCPVDAHCRLGTCVSDAPPRAVASGPSTASVHAEAAFDGSASSDADDALVAYTWSVRLRSAACAPDLGVSSGRTFRPLFACPGDFDVILVVKDATGVASEPSMVPVTVADRAGVPPTVATGPALTLAHRCAGTPPSCSVLGTDGSPWFQLSAAAQGSEAVRYRWDWAAPPATDGTAPQVQFPAGVDGASPTVSITGSGAVLTGPWTFVVTVTDANGLSARAEQPVVVQNAPPVVSGGGPVTPTATYDTATGRYRATGALAFTVSDPDGDPVTTTWRFASSSADHCTFGPGAGGDGTFALACVDAAELSSGAVRTITLQAADTSGAVSAPVTWTVTVTR